MIGSVKSRGWFKSIRNQFEADLVKKVEDVDAAVGVAEAKNRDRIGPI